MIKFIVNYLNKLKTARENEKKNRLHVISYSGYIYIM
jgi:hypothetical protein